MNIEIKIGDRVLKGGKVYVSYRQWHAHLACRHRFREQQRLDVTVGKPGAIYQYMGDDNGIRSIWRRQLQRFRPLEAFEHPGADPGRLRADRTPGEIRRRQTKKFIATAAAPKAASSRNQINANVTASIDTATIRSRADFSDRRPDRHHQGGRYQRHHLRNDERYDASAAKAAFRSPAPSSARRLPR